jgi:nucleoside-diphosphate kinase
MEPFTLMLLKPDAISRSLQSEILAFLKKKGVEVIQQKEVIVTSNQILTHYQELLERLNIPYLSQAIEDEFVGNKILALKLKVTIPVEDPIGYIRMLIGATDPLKASDDTIRGMFRQDTLALSIQEKRMLRNLVHASDSLENAIIESNIWFS